IHLEIPIPLSSAAGVVSSGQAAGNYRSAVSYGITTSNSRLSVFDLIRTTCGVERFRDAAADSHHSAESRGSHRQ
ncbi:MAG: hypothetical protein QGF59_28505, partial [Pirellulaceae bacterium]|nr:hypothetical protein [Pirellulaceae bacterium]